MKPALIVFARQPVPGKAKTRLARHCGDKIAANIASYLLKETVSLAASVWQGPIALYCWPDPEHELFKELSGEYGLSLATQCAGSLGDKMYTALQNECSHHGAAAVMGTDVPHCPGQVLNEAYTLLSAGKSVIGPTNDGGYYFLGIQKPDNRFFKNINWGSDSVYSDTLARAEETGISFNKLPVVRDIDDWQDLVEAAKLLPGLKQYLD